MSLLKKLAIGAVTAYAVYKVRSRTVAGVEQPALEKVALDPSKKKPVKRRATRKRATTVAKNA